MVYVLYNALMSLAAPVAAGYLVARRERRRLMGRFRPSLADTHASRPIWVHACSVGEVGVARPIVRAIEDRWPDCAVVLTVSTAAGFDFARNGKGAPSVTWCPFDHPLIVRGFVKDLRPRALLLVETELWPNLLRETRRAGTPVVLVNGRLSDKFQRRYERYGFLLRPVAEHLTLAAMQNREYADRLARLGVSGERIRVTGNTKFDGVRTETPPEKLAALREVNGFDPSATILLFGSTRPGDEALAADCWKRLAGRFPDLRAIVAPRHSDRLAEAMAPFDEPILRRSEVRAGRRPSGERVFFLDTVGELVDFYGLATVAVIGGSFYPGVNGHNPLESAALGVPTVFGPFMRNFVDPARELVARDGAVQVASPEELPPALEALLRNPERRARLARNGREAVLANQGAIARTLDLIAPYVETANGAG